MRRRLLTVPQLIVCGLATHRFVKLWMNDSIADPLRALQERYMPAPGEQIQATKIDWVLKDTGDLNPHIAAETTRIKPPSPNLFNPIYAEGNPDPILYVAPKGTWIGQLLTCYSCFGVWSAFAILIAARTRLLRPLVDALAVSAVGYWLYTNEQRGRL